MRLILILVTVAGLVAAQDIPAEETAAPEPSAADVPAEGTGVAGRTSSGNSPRFFDGNSGISIGGPDVNHNGGLSHSSGLLGGVNSNFGLQGGLSSAPGLQGGFNSNPGLHQGFNSNPGLHQGFNSNPGLDQGFNSNSGLHQGFNSNSGLHQGFNSNSGLHQGFNSNSGMQGGFNHAQGLIGNLQPGLGLQGGLQTGVGGLHPSLLGQGSLNPLLGGPTFGQGMSSLGVKPQCKFFCRGPDDKFQCCDKREKPGFCPGIRPSCPRFFGPVTCTDDTLCPGTEKCCFDICICGKVCKPPESFHPQPNKVHIPGQCRR